jgi:energy-coupling factor transporter ATP-binding protein EcfA2
MNPQETGALHQLILAIREEGIAILLIEHDMKLVMGLSDTLFVLDYGRLIAEGPPQAVRNTTASTNRTGPAFRMTLIGQEQKLFFTTKRSVLCIFTRRLLTLIGQDSCPITFCRVSAHFAHVLC